MSSIFIETTNEKQLTVEEYIRYIGLKDRIQQVLDNTDIKEVLREAEESINGLTVDLTIKYSINKKRP